MVYKSNFEIWFTNFILIIKVINHIDVKLNCFKDTFVHCIITILYALSDLYMDHCSFSQYYFDILWIHLFQLPMNIEAAQRMVAETDSDLLMAPV